MVVLSFGWRSRRARALKLSRIFFQHVLARARLTIETSRTTARPQPGRVGAEAPEMVATKAIAEQFKQKAAPTHSKTE